MSNLAFIAFCACIAAAPPAASIAPPTGVSGSPVAPAEPAPPGVLAGPRVAAAPADAKPTTVNRGFDGMLEPLDAEPETAAVFQLKLDDESLRAVEAREAARSKAFSDFVTAHYDQVLAAGSDLQAMRAMEPADRAAAFGRIRKLFADMQPFTARGTFIEECTGILTAEQQAEARRMVTEWHAARKAELRREIFPDVTGELDRQADERLEFRMRLESIGGMVKRTITQRAESRKAQFEDVTNRLDLTPEQTEKVRNLFMEIGVQEIQGKREPGAYSMRERQQIFGELAKILDETQRAKLRDLIISRGASQQEP
ncbi:MAG: hypothetical protein RL254_1152 [Planctomycetota bacterium]|jgi:hypothetical protein